MIQRYITVKYKGVWEKLYLGKGAHGKFVFWNGIEFITKIYRVRHGNGYYGTIKGQEIHDLYNPSAYVYPNTPAQQTQTAKLTAARGAWDALTSSQKEAYRDLATPSRFALGRTFFMSAHMLAN